MFGVALTRGRDRIIDPQGRRRLTRNEKVGIGSLAVLLGVAAAWPVRALAKLVRPEAAFTATTVDEALQKIAEGPAVVLVDYHLHDRLDGLATLDALRAASPGPIAGALLTADGRDELKRMARDRGYRLLTKPIKPASLRAFLAAQHTAAQSPG